ncbi:hypothetical protein Ait01nite_089890 [Actinoplanes italicus]|uniref:Uncharacterized protein n=1 Tax=Actinoplanes italicus TaxID=113567 RepID=A0A2T0JIJ5_9ACTN|nr:hypothetical protein [Actinoplanes italicus]PRX07406.1 hypothetical protein CLV67_14281 [Actinoplanes italicus]GIE35944.1 hypothetical protein Ait01nite_089890 [Actinoplanes italicus]
MAACTAPELITRVDRILGQPDRQLEPCADQATRVVAITVDRPGGIAQHVAPACLWCSLVVRTRHNGHLVRSP